MAILFEWYETPVPNNETDETEKTTIHARITLNGKVGTDEIRRKIQKRSSLTETDVSAVYQRCTLKDDISYLLPT